MGRDFARIYNPVASQERGNAEENSGRELLFCVCVTLFFSTEFFYLFFVLI